MVLTRFGRLVCLAACGLVVAAAYCAVAAGGRVVCGAVRSVGERVERAERAAAAKFRG